MSDGVFKLVLLRHGESVWNAENLFTGWEDVDLSPAGEQEAVKAGKCLKEKGFKFDVVFTSVLKRSIKTAWTALMNSDNYSMPMINTWRLNERHYGALQGLNKAETAAKHGEEQVKIWRRSYDVPPPSIEVSDQRHPSNDPKYRSIPEQALPGAESLALTVDRVLPFWFDVIAPQVKAGRRAMVVAHGNSLRALCKYLEKMSDKEVLDLNIPTAVPLVYELTPKLQVVKKYYLMDPDEVERANIMAELKATATKLCAPGKGFLASDESAGPWLRAGHSEAAKIPDTIENRAAYRAMCFETPGIGEHISGVILHWETLFQKDASGKDMVDIIKDNGMIPGIKLDKAYDKKGMWGTEVGPLGHPEVSTRGLDDLQQRCAEAYKKGARFAKWRNVLQLDPEKGLPSDLAIADTVHTLARYASICQSERLVPIVEPEIVPNGSHDIAYCAKMTEKVLVAQFKALALHHVYLEGAVLKPNMVKNGLTGPRADHETVATLTVQTLLRTVPPNMPGIFFLSGETALDEDNEETATINLMTMNKLQRLNLPWHLSFSYGKALQKTCIATWLGKDENKQAAQKALKARSNANSDAVFGTYVPGSCSSIGTDGNVIQAAGPY